MAIATINPATNETVRVFQPLSEAEVDGRIASAHAAFVEWSRMPVRERAGVVACAADILDAEKEQFGRLMTLEMGKPLRAAVEEAAKCATGCRYYAEHAERFLSPEWVTDSSGERAYVVFQPLGVVLAIMPWNFPFWQVVRFAAPALCAGNVGLLKHASNVPQCALALEDLFRRAGAPPGVFQTLLVGSAQVERIIDDPRVAAATLTGSEAAGRAVAAASGRNIKKTVLELGGSDPFIVMPSADLNVAVRTAVRARTINNGQSCIAAKRFIVAAAVADDFERAFVAGMRELRVGDPFAEDTDVGPLATAEILRDLEEQVATTVAAGGRILTGGARIARPGNYYEPTVLADIPRDSPAYRDELFGPVASLFRVRGIDEALAIANGTTFGLGASAWTTDPAEAERFAAELEAGQVFVNAMVVSDPRFPFGGVKRSGYGRELSAYGLREFVNVKTVRMTFGDALKRTETE